MRSIFNKSHAADSTTISLKEFDNKVNVSGVVYLSRGVDGVDVLNICLLAIRLSMLGCVYCAGDRWCMPYAVGYERAFDMVVDGQTICPQSLSSYDDTLYIR